MARKDPGGSRPVDEPQKITRDDIEAKFRQLTGDVDQQVDAARSTITTVAVAAGAVLVVVVFLVGRSRGRRKTTVVEIRRY